MTTRPAELTIQRHDGHGLREHKDELLEVYQEAYAERLSVSGPILGAHRTGQRTGRLPAGDRAGQG